MRRKEPNKICLLLGAVWALSAAAQPLKLVQEGKSTYSIVISTDASPSEKHGAQELQKFLEEMSGARLPVVTDAQAARGKPGASGRQQAVEGQHPIRQSGSRCAKNLERGC
jgi:hypothetical protein